MPQLCHVVVCTVIPAAEVGDESCTPELAACLKVPELHDLAEEVLWAVWYRHPNPEAKALMNQGLTMLRDSSRLQPALDVFEAACRIEPSWAEVSSLSHDSSGYVAVAMLRQCHTRQQASGGFCCCSR